MAKKNATKNVPPDVQTIELVEKFEREAPKLTAEEILEKELERLSMRIELANKRKGYLEIAEQLKEIGENLDEMQEGDEFETQPKI